MPTAFRLPELGENIEKGKVTSVLVAEGDAIAADQPIIEIETDKASVEVPSDVAGTISSLKVKEGQELEVGAVILEVEDGGGEGKEEEEGKAEAEAPQEEAEQAEEAPQEEAEPEASEEEPEDQSESGEEAPAEPAKEEKKAQQPQKKPAQKQQAEPPKTEAARSMDTDSTQNRGPVPAPPSVRRLAREIGVDIYRVKGSGPGGRITEEDIKDYARQVNTDTGGSAPVRTGGGASKGAPQPPLPDFARWGAIHIEEMGGVRKRTAENMAYAWTSVPHVTQFDKADVTEVEKLRKNYGKLAEKQGGKLTMTAILVKVAAAALKKFPQFNASLDLDNNEIIYKDYRHIGVAVDTDRGLLVPVLRDCDQKGVIEIAVELGEMAERARTKKTSLDEMQGGTFTISNLGGIGGTAFTPIVYAPQVAILGVARTQTEPLWDGSQFVPRQMLPLSLSYDHRVIDGADGARFLRWIAAALEQPFLMLLEGD